MADRTLTVTHAGGSSETYTINRDKVAGVRTMQLDAAPLSDTTTQIQVTVSGHSDLDGIYNVSTSGSGSLAYRSWNQQGGNGIISAMQVDPIDSGNSSEWAIIDGSDGDPFTSYFGVYADDRPWKPSNTGIVTITPVTETITVDRTAPVVTSDKAGESRPLLSKVVGGAAVAYSLRDLNDKAGNNKVVRVRRESDNHERDFLAKEVANGTMTDWVNTQTVLPLDLQALTNDGRTGSVIGADAAYSLRNLSSSYTGNVVDVRRSSDDTVQGFKASDIVSGGAIETFCGTGDGFVSKWYDQSGNSNHATQTDPAEQPAIVTSGALNTSGGLEFDGTDDTFSLTNSISFEAIAGSVIAVQEAQSSSHGFTLGISNSNRGLNFSTTTTRWYFTGNEVDISRTNASISGVRLSTVIHDGTTNNPNVRAFTNGSENIDTTPDVHQGQLNAIHSAANQIGGRRALGHSNADFFTGTMKELIVYRSDQTDNRTALEANIAEHYSISGVPTATDTVNGFVETWYDQSGNGSDATQTTIAKQPKIVDGGSLVTGGIDFLNGTSTGLETNNSDICNVPQLSIFTVLTPHTAASQTQAFSCGSVIAGSTGYGGWKLNFNGYSDDVNFQTQARGNTSASGLTVDVTSSECLIAYVATFPNATGSVNGGTAVTKSNMISPNQTSTNTRKFRIGGQFTFNFAANYTKPINEIIIYTTDQSANRPAIEANIKNQYNLT